MPIYEYRCDNGHTFDVIQKFADEPLSACEECGAPARRVLHPVAIHFKGSGFYSTDYGRGKKVGAEAKAEARGDSAKGGGESSSSSGKDSGGSDTSSDKGSGSSSSSGTAKAAEG
ncbi:MAG TPA: FmdB family zinc ribbon protein [Gaiellales bacterium]|nr:FmdB family zinc ribbon protein [Gaiellales bacterium]